MIPVWLRDFIISRSFNTTSHWSRVLQDRGRVVIRSDGEGCSRQIPGVDRGRSSGLRPAGANATPSPPAVHYKLVVLMSRWAR